LGELQTIFVDVEQENPVALSDISDEVKAIELELTNESLIGWVMKVLRCDEYIIVLEGQESKILLFDNNGKFVRRIGARGQGPEEYIYCTDITIDDKNKHLYIADYNRIICYDYEGNFIEKIPCSHPEYINYVNDELLVLSTFMGLKIDNGYLNQTILYRINKAMQITDSADVKKIFLKNLSGASNSKMDYVTYVDGNTYLYYPVLTSESIVRDTLYQLKDNHLIPHLKLKFSDENVTVNGMKNKHLLNICKSTRYIFANYQKRDAQYCFCYDSKTGKGFNFKDGFTDDIHNIGKAYIRPFNTNVGMFYYLHTNDNDANNEEPNPTLYIGVLKN
jgi:hypothetical protein